MVTSRILPLDKMSANGGTSHGAGRRRAGRSFSYASIDLRPEEGKGIQWILALRPRVTLFRRRAARGPQRTHSPPSPPRSRAFTRRSPRARPAPAGRLPCGLLRLAGLARSLRVFHVKHRSLRDAPRTLSLSPRARASAVARSFVDAPLVCSPVAARLPFLRLAPAGRLLRACPSGSAPRLSAAPRLPVGSRAPAPRLPVACCALAPRRFCVWRVWCVPRKCFT